MLNDVEWNNMILEAEEYFVDGQLGFILDFSKENDDVSKELFKINFNIAKKIFDGKKMLNSTLTSGLLERALLCMPDFSHNSTAHLLSNPILPLLGDSIKKIIINFYLIEMVEKKGMH